MSQTRIKTIGGTNTTIKRPAMGTTTIRMYDRLDSGGNGNTETEVTGIHLFF